jgi:hypothetical protein
VRRKLFNFAAAVSLVLLVFIVGCTTSRTYETSETLLREAIPVAVLNTMALGGNFDTSARAYFAEINLLGWGYTAIRVTWTPTSEPGSIRVTADAYGYNWITGTLIKYDDPDDELKFHRQLKIALDRASTQTSGR